MKLEQHPLSAAFPRMPAEDFDALKSDIAANGQIEPGILFEGMVLDGWNRYQACEANGLPFETVEFSGGDPVAYVISRNAHRRHLNASQRAAAIVACSKWRESGITDDQAGRNPVPTLTEAEMAQAAGVSDRTIRQAKEAERAGLGEAVRDGKVSAKRAAEAAKLPEQERAAAIEEPPPKPAKLKPVAPDEAAQLRQRVADLEAQLTELGANLKEAIADNESMAALFEADDKLAEANRQLVQQRAEIRVLRERVNGLMNEKNAAVRAANSWKKKAGANDARHAA